MRRALLCATVSLIAVGGFTSALAQTTPPTGLAGGESSAAPGAGSFKGSSGSAAAAAATAGVTVGDVIVTAQRREQRLQQAPVAVTALTAKTLDQLNIRDSQDLMQVVPGLQTATQTAGDNGGSATFFLRGLGQERSGNGSEPAVGIYVDDFYYPSLSGTLFKIVDLAQVEVLRGPQGTLFGRNTIGGAIRYTSQAPVLGVFSGTLTGTAGNYSRYDIAGVANLPIGDKAAIRITAGHLEENGYVHVQSGGPDAGRTTTNLVRVQARVDPTNTVHIDLSGQWSRDNLQGFTYNLPGPLTPTPPAPGASPSVPFIYNIIAAGHHLPLYTNALESTCFYCEPGPDRPEFSRTTYKNLLATIGWDIAPGLTIKSLTGYQRVNNDAQADLDGTIAPLYDIGDTPTLTTAFSQELQVNGKLLDDRLNFVAGGFYYRERTTQSLSLTPVIALGSPTYSPLTDRATDSYAGYIDAAFKITSKLSLLGGYRYSDDQKQIIAYSQVPFALLGTRSASFGSSTYRVGLQYQWTPDIMTYGNVSTGFRAGGFNPYNAAQILSLQPFSPETARTYEVGMRTQFFDRRITLNPTAFYEDWSNIQVQSVVITNPASGTGGPILQNVGAARSYGVELEGSALVNDQFRLFGNLAYLNIKYTKIGGATGLTLNSPLERSPAITFSVGGAYTLNFDHVGKLVTTLNYAYEGDQQSAPTTSLLIPAYGLLNGRLELTPRGQRFSVALFATNILDKDYYAGGVNYTNIVGSPHYDVGRPREFGATVRANF